MGRSFLPQFSIVRNGGIHFKAEISLGNLISLITAVITIVLAWQSLVHGQSVLNIRLDTHITEDKEAKASFVSKDTYESDQKATADWRKQVTDMLTEIRADVKLHVKDHRSHR